MAVLAHFEPESGRSAGSHWSVIRDDRSEKSFEVAINGCVGPLVVWLDRDTFGIYRQGSQSQRHIELMVIDFGDDPDADSVYVALELFDFASAATIKLLDTLSGNRFGAALYRSRLQRAEHG
jgi:hypothetical protein